MRVLVSGANGFLGRHLVAALLDSGHAVRALIRPSVEVEALGWQGRVEIQRADLVETPDLAAAFDGIDTVVHLAAAMTGDAAGRFATTVTGTERLLTAMACSNAGRLVLCSSFSVYDWVRASGIINENLPLREPVECDGAIDPAGGYAAAKIVQERLARAFAAEHGWQLVVLRPGFIWGRGNEEPRGSMGRSLGRLHFVLSPGRQLPFTYVENCADCLRAAVEAVDSARPVRDFNVLDGYELSAWRYMGELLASRVVRGLRVPIPYQVLVLLAGLGRGIFRVLRGTDAPLPSLIDPNEIAQIYRPLSYSVRALTDHLGWTPPFGLEDCLHRTFHSPPANRSTDP